MISRKRSETIHGLGNHASIEGQRRTEHVITANRKHCGLYLYGNGPIGTNPGVGDCAQSQDRQAATRPLGKGKDDVRKQHRSADTEELGRKMW